MKQTVEEAAHSFAVAISGGSLFPAYYKGFIAGANWRINSVWHKTRLEKNCRTLFTCNFMEMVT